MGSQTFQKQFEDEVSFVDYRFHKRIRRLPYQIRSLNEKLFTPSTVSIGPIHRDNSKLKEFQTNKKKIVSTLFGDDNTLNECYLEARQFIADIKKFYIWPREYTDAEIVAMVVDDALFIIAFCKLMLESPDAKYNFFYQCIARDLLLIENQVPIFVVEKLFSCTIKDPSATLPRYLLPVISKSYLFIDAKGEVCVDVDQAFSSEKHIHILEFMWSLYLPSETLFKDPTKSRARYAIRLYSRSIKFEPHTNSQWAMKILVKTSTGRRATLKLPILNVNCNTEFVLNNLIAYEQSHDHTFVTSYVHLMCALMETVEDVERLRMARVLVNNLKSDQEASDIFKAALTNFPPEPTFYGKQMQELDEYFKTSWIAWAWTLCSKPYLI